MEAKILFIEFLMLANRLSQRNLQRRRSSRTHHSRGVVPLLIRELLQKSPKRRGRRLSQQTEQIAIFADGTLFDHERVNRCDGRFLARGKRARNSRQPSRQDMDYARWARGS
jgi:hypothetical protein